jgi:hypothetical protein
MVVAPDENFRHNLFFADVALGDVLDRDPGLRRHCRRARTHRIAQCRGELRIIEGPDVAGVKKSSHAGGVAHAGKSPGHHHPVITGQHAGNPLVIALRQPSHRSPPYLGTGRQYYKSLIGSGSAGLGHR